MFKTKEGWLVGLGQEGVTRGWVVCLKYYKRSWNRKEEEGKQIFLKSGGLGQGVGALRGLEPLYELLSPQFSQCISSFQGA